MKIGLQTAIGRLSSVRRLRRGGNRAGADREITAKADIDLDAIRDFAVAWLRREQDQDLRAFRLSLMNIF